MRSEHLYIPYEDQKRRFILEQAFPNLSNLASALDHQFVLLVNLSKVSPRLCKLKPRLTFDKLPMAAALERASEFELLAETEVSADVRLRFRIVARHYRDLADREEKADKTKFAERIERVRLQRQQVAPKPTLPATSDTQYFLIAAE